MGKSKIEWTDRTWNPVTGCTPISPACDNCYARRMARRLAGRCGYLGKPREFMVTEHWDRMSEPSGWRKSQRVFVVSMGDLFHSSVRDDVILRVFMEMRANSRHTFQLLTKRIENARAFYERYPEFDWLENVWTGATVENQYYANQRATTLSQIQAIVRYLSIEPMLGPIDLAKLPPLDWVICGGETGSGARPMKLDWAQRLRDQCYNFGVPFFYKGAGTATMKKSDPNYRLLDGELYEQFPGDVR